ncbi:hypothetical protein DM02DRAFT_677192 [Periconia macrospinosa]|uniref:Caspase domain-containing protein n=1 Tax=Periconia macrospinosa TaxID=97972 RepID=A0A2V1D4I9_9PLEO|nr:hypothetical protein DM02DRAFT_677192 [Periconia macrospinosa]
MDAETSHWAILIGVNFHKEKPLQGCVRDVETMKHCLENYLDTGLKPPQIVTLTATCPDNPNATFPTEKPDSWPTYENVISNLEDITARAKPGDFVHIHYSGHGTRLQPDPESSKNDENTESLALVLFDPVEGSRYLFGSDLVNKLNNMVQKGLLLTIVLDCCFSGSVVRHGNLPDASIRTVPYDPNVDAAYPREPVSPPNHTMKPALRDTHVLPEWLINPEGYTILSACGPHQVAEELTIESGKAAGKKNGALSFFLAFTLISLWKSRTQITHQSLYQHLCVQFHVNWPRQTPMRYGNGHLSFFGKPRPGLDASFFPVFRKGEHDQLQLGAGLAHGVCEGDEFAIYPFDSPDDTSLDMRNIPYRLTANNVQSLASDLIGTEPVFRFYQTKPGWKARLLTRLSSCKVPVRLLPTVNDRTQWILSAEHRRFISLHAEDVEERTCLFNVTLNNGREYEILDDSYQSIVSLPAIPSQMQGASRHVTDILEHLAAFTHFKGIDNRTPDASFENSFKLRLADSNGQDLTELGMIEAKEEGVLCLTVENYGNRPIYVAVFDLGPEWQIDNLLSQEGGGGFGVFPPSTGVSSGKEQISWRMSIPQSYKKQGVRQCHDVLKVFVTSRASSFESMLLPKIPLSTTRSDGSCAKDYNRLSMFLSRLTVSSRSEYDSEDAWAVRDFFINTNAMVERNNKMLTCVPASSRNILSLQNWVNGNACLAREETAYLTYLNDLVSVTSSGDDMADIFKAWIEDKLVGLCRIFSKVRICNSYLKVWAKNDKDPQDISRDSNVYVFSGSFAAKAARALIASILILFLLAPAIICNSINGLTHRTIVVVTATILVVAALSSLTKARTVEIFIAGTTYATVLVVFISGTNLTTS